MLKIPDFKPLFLIFTMLLFCAALMAQVKTITNQDVILMSQADVSEDLILQKIKDSEGSFEIGSKDIIKLKNSGVSDKIIMHMLEKMLSKTPNQKDTVVSPKSVSSTSPKTDIEVYNREYGNRVSIKIGSNQKRKSIRTYRSKSSYRNIRQKSRVTLTAKQALLNAKTISIRIDSIYPKTVELEGKILRRKNWSKLGLSMVSHGNNADLYIVVDNIPLTMISARYVYRVYDRKTGTIVTSGETTAWGGLANNLARKISKGLNKTLTHKK